MNKLKHFAAAALVAGAVFAGSAANAATQLSTTSAADAYFGVFTDASTTSTGTFSLLAGYYNFALTANSQYYIPGFSGPSSISVTLYDSSNHVVKTLSESFTGPASGSIAASASTTATFALSGGLYHFAYSISSPAAVSSALTSIHAVPGPIAGAGLPALLGLLGFAGYRRSKKNA